MNAKENKKIVSIKNCIKVAIVLFFVTFSTIFYNMYFKTNKTYATERKEIQNENIKISNANRINIDEIISENTNDEYIEEITKKEEILEYLTQYKTNKDIPKGVSYVIQEGGEGKQEIIIKSIYNKNGEKVSEEQIGANVIKASYNKIVEIGGGNYTSSYNVKKGDIIYVTADLLPMFLEPTEQSTKMTTLGKNEEIKVIEIKDSWYKVLYNNRTGWIKAECTTYINPNKDEKYMEQNELTKQQLMKNVNFSMKLNTPSGLTLEQFKKVLLDEKDKNKIFANNAEFFYYIEKQYKINGIFVAAVGIHESAWGTSQIALNKNNLFGYGAYDSNPYNGAYQFSNYSESIDLIARVLVKYYLNPSGTEIYGGEKAAGTYYNGPTLSGVNTRYATDKNWANGVFSHMQYLYNKL